MSSYIKATGDHRTPLMFKPFPFGLNTLTPGILTGTFLPADSRAACLQILELLFQPVICHPYFEYWVIPCS